MVTYQDKHVFHILSNKKFTSTIENALREEEKEGYSLEML